MGTVRVFLKEALFFCLLAMAINTQAQQYRNKEELIMLLMERFTETQEQEGDYLDLQDLITFRLDNPLNINRATAGDLADLPIRLTAAQVQAILRHRTRYGKFLSVYELQSIPELDDETCRLLMYLVRTDAANLPGLRDLVREGKHELFLFYEHDFQRKKGFKIADTAAGTPGISYFTGTPGRFLSRYRYFTPSGNTIGFTVEKDDGEQFPQQNAPLAFDFVSVHLFLRNVWKLKTLAVGDYQASFGQGITFGSGLAFGKSAAVLNFRRAFNGLRPYRGVNENEFLRGAGATFAHKNLELTAFYSALRIDANVQESLDTLSREEMFVSSLQTSGLHRTYLEIEKRNQIKQTRYGANFRYRKGNHHIGLTYAATLLDFPLNPSLSPYNKFSLRDRQLHNAGVDWSFLLRNVNLFGEATRNLNDSGGYGIMAGMLASLGKKLDVGINYRNFSKRFMANQSNPWAETSRLAGEQGIYFSARLVFNRRWTLLGYYDLYRVNWLQYQVDAPARGQDGLAELQYSPSRKTMMYLRYRNEVRERNNPSGETPFSYLLPQTRRTFRYDLTIDEGNTRFHSRIEFSYFNREGREVLPGVMIFQDIIQTSARKRFTLVIRLAYFSVKGFDARIFAFERDVLNNFTIPFFYGNGMRFYAMVKYRLSRRIDLWARYAITTCTDREVIGSGLDEIQGPSQSDLRLQMRLMF